MKFNVGDRVKVNSRDKVKRYGIITDKYYNFYSIKLDKSLIFGNITICSITSKDDDLELIDEPEESNMEEWYEV